MTSPRVLDAKGRELSVGDRVLNNGCHEGEVLGFRPLRTGLRVEVRWDDGPATAFVASPTHGVLRVPALELLDPEGEGEKT